MWFEVFNKVQGHRESRGVTEEQVIGKRSRELQPNGFGRPNPQFLVDRFVQSINISTSDLSAAVPDIAD